MSDPNDTVTKNRRRGRPSLNGAALTQAERQRRSRAAKRRQREAKTLSRASAETIAAKATAKTAPPAKPAKMVGEAAHLRTDSRAAMARDAARARREVEKAEEARWRARLAAAEAEAGVRVQAMREAMQQAGLLPRSKRRDPAAEE